MVLQAHVVRQRARDWNLPVCLSQYIPLWKKPEHSSKLLFTIRKRQIGQNLAGLCVINVTGPFVWCWVVITHSSTRVVHYSCWCHWSTAAITQESVSPSVTAAEPPGGLIEKEWENTAFSTCACTSSQRVEIVNVVKVSESDASYAVFKFKYVLIHICLIFLKFILVAFKILCWLKKNWKQSVICCLVFSSSFKVSVKVRPD